MEFLNQEQLESKWRERWRQAETDGSPPRNSDDPEARRYYCLDMFPYPSLGGLSVNQLRGMTVSDVVCRYQEARGRHVLRPMGWDSFGLSIEQEAQRHKIPPDEVVARGTELMREQMRQMGLRIDWDREIHTSDPSYYRWTQWLFLQLLERGLAYKAETSMKWCPECHTNLANEEVQEGSCLHCSSQVEDRQVSQWMLRITEYAERLHHGLKDLRWPARVKAMQRNWIGRRTGFRLLLKATNEFQTDFEEFDVFIRRLELVPGATFVVLAPEHPLVERITDSLYLDEVLEYRDEVVRKTERERLAASSEPVGRPTGAYAINPVTLRALPIWVSEIVLPTVRFGAIFGVPGHDERHAAFAKTHRLSSVTVISKRKSRGRKRRDRNRRGSSNRAHHSIGDDLAMINCGTLSGASVADARRHIRRNLESRGILDAHIDYHLRDWIFSRQQYWGEPIPVLYDENGEVHPVPEEDLPVEVPRLEKVPVGEAGHGPLHRVPEFREVKTEGGETWERETDTMPQWIASCWYYLRYLGPDDDTGMFPEDAKPWLPVDLCVGGIEHAILHLLYVRFVSYVLHDLGLTTREEPFRRVFNQGRIYSVTPAEERRKIPTHRGDRIEARPFLERAGGDALRLHLLFLGPAESDVMWSESGLRGCRRFLDRAAEVIRERRDKGRFVSRKVLVEKHRLIRRVSRAIRTFRLNKAVSGLMEFVKFLREEDLTPEEVDRATLRTFTILLAPFAPYLASELWEVLEEEGSVLEQPWPEYSKELLKPLEVEMVVQVDNRTCDRIVVEDSPPDDELIALAQQRERVQQAIGHKKVQRWIVVPDRLINAVLKESRSKAEPVPPEEQEPAESPPSRRRKRSRRSKRASKSTPETAEQTSESAGPSEASEPAESSEAQPAEHSEAPEPSPENSTPMEDPPQPSRDGR